MLEQLREFTSKWYGEVIPNKTDLCSFSLKTLYAVVKFGGLVALVLQPVAFGPLGFMLDRSEMLEVNIVGVYYIACFAMFYLYCAFAVLCIGYLAFNLCIIVNGCISNALGNIRCSKTIKFTDEDD